MALTRATPPDLLRVPWYELRVSATAWLGRGEAARRLLEEARAAFPDSPRLSMMQAEVFRALGQVEAEREALNKLLATPGLPWPRRVRRRLRQLAR